MIKTYFEYRKSLITYVYPYCAVYLNIPAHSRSPELQISVEIKNSHIHTYSQVMKKKHITKKFTLHDRYAKNSLAQGSKQGSKKKTTSSYSSIARPL